MTYQTELICGWNICVKLIASVHIDIPVEEDSKNDIADDNYQ